ncbi:hypothetical protein [Sphingomonas radiodurans]|uniref:hypothetical protein n=1 Tax=Sphingomonas radiodurans TaxID=2890321 RepID=UPI001E2A9713|nr:hypothetical protein [Sphingomonas radiodurans]WBH15636.1 hypothetical protein LLW23_12500 [Sphingomonas radiodurans]
MFLFGFALGGSSALWHAIARLWPIKLAIVGLSGAIVVWLELTYQGSAVPSHAMMAIDRAARLAMAWGVIVALLRLADARFNHDHPVRAPLAEAVFPSYLIHHPVLVVLAWLAPSRGMGAGVGFVFLFSATIAACASAYLVGREIKWLRPLIGLAQAPARAKPLTA